MTEQITLKIRKGFTAIPNELITTTRLSVDARILMMSLLSFSDNWVCRPTHLKKILGTTDKPIGRDKFDRVKKELVDIGFLTVNQVRGDGGIFDKTVWEITDDIQAAVDGFSGNGEAEPQITVDGSTVDGKPAHIRNNNGLRNNNSKSIGDQAVIEILIETGASRDVISDFVEFRRKDKKSKVTERAARMMVKAFSEHQLTSSEADAAFNASIANGWQGVFPDKFKNKGGQNAKARSGVAAVDTRKIAGARMS